LAQIVLEEVPVAEYRKRVLKAANRLLARIEPGPAEPPVENGHDDGS
jgi:hypothetical protein